MSIIDFENLGKSFGFRWALKDASAGINEGDFIGLAGANGSGKTTLINLLCRIYRPSSGRVNYNLPENYRGFLKKFYLFAHQTMFYSHFSALENLQLNFQLRRPDSVPQYNEVLDFTGLIEFRHQRIDTYSTGMLKRLNIANMINLRPQYIFFDEPFQKLRLNMYQPEGDPNCQGCVEKGELMGKEVQKK